ncbi:MAG: RNA methyltransferase [Bacteriovoracaceae bacterium]|nr:RNA methyltransferase [Bacteriovoracaceae bacterium]
MTTIYLGLVHHPILNKRGAVGTTSVTNLDIHDIARASKTFGIKKYFIITPLVPQHELVSKILGHWESEEGAIYNPDRQEALSVAQLSFSVQQAQETIHQLEQREPLLVVTGANFKECHGNEIDLLTLSHKLDKRPIFLLFGTGWGLAQEITQVADFKLAPINGSGHYNHLSVRSAVSIYCDRLNQAQIKLRGSL